LTGDWTAALEDEEAIIWELDAFTGTIMLLED